MSQSVRFQNQLFVNRLLAAFPGRSGLVDSQQLEGLQEAANALPDPEAQAAAQRIIDRFQFDEGEHDLGFESEAQRKDVAQLLGVRLQRLPRAAHEWIQDAIPPANVRMQHIDDFIDLTGPGPYYPMTRSLTFEAPKEGTAPVLLDADQNRLKINTVQVEGEDVSFRRRDNRLYVEMPAGANRLDFDYLVKASNDLSGFGLMHDPVTGDFTTLTWPDRAGQLGPASANPGDRVTSSVHVRVPKGVQVLGTGRQEGDFFVLDQGVGIYAAPQFVASPRLNFSDWKVSQHGVRFRWAGLGDEVSTERRQKLLDDAIHAADFRHKHLGPCRHAEFTLVEAQGAMGGMEHAGTPIIYLCAAKDPVAARDVTDHEMGHPWTGNGVSFEHWNDFWISEGHTTYWEARSIEERDGHARFLEILDTSKEKGGKALVRKNHALVPEPDMDIIRAFDRIPYDFGAWILRMIETMPEVGRERFGAMYKDWYQQKTGGAPVSTTEFIDFASEKLKLDLHPFFNQWNALRAIPTFESQVVPNAQGAKVTLKASTPFPKVLALPLRLVGANGEEKTVRINPKQSPVQVDCDFAVIRTEWDPERTVFAQVS